MRAKPTALNEPVVQLPPHWRGRTLTPDTFRAQQPGWWLVNYGWDRWHQAGITGRDVVIVVLDTGVDKHHAEIGDLAGQVLHVESTIGGAGYDDNGHGTMVASTCAALTDLGVAPESSILSFKCLDRSGVGTLRGILEAVSRGCEKGLELGGGHCLVNCSWGADRQIPAIEEQLQRWSERGAVFHCAAGNGGQDNGVDWPGRSRFSHAWGAHDITWKLAFFSDRGSQVDAVSSGVDLTGSSLNGNRQRWSGTSAACPSGLSAHALLWHAEKLRYGEIRTKTVDQFRAKLDAATVDLGPPGRDPGHGRGRVDADKLLTLVDEPSPPPPPPPGAGKRWATQVVDGVPVYVAV